MENSLANRIRMEQTHRELLSLSGRISKWLKQRTDRDKEGQHKTQLESLRTVLIGASEELHRNLSILDIKLESGSFYDQCRELDQAIIWLERLWQYFQSKLDQRDDERLGPLLEAADEVVWSCYKGVVDEGAKRAAGITQGPMPLSFIEAQYSPAALQSDKGMPSELRLTADIDFLDDYLTELPIPLLRLPPWCVDAPWWLIYVGHEVGHHVQRKLDLVDFFQEGIETTLNKKLSKGDETEKDIKEWGAWGKEIFADMFSIMMMGPWAVWAIVEAELSTPGAMVERKDAYPSPVVRLSLMSMATNKLFSASDGKDETVGTAALHGLSLEAVAASSALAQKDVKVAKDVLEFVLGPMRDNLGALQNLCRVDKSVYLSDGGQPSKIEKWSQRLRTKVPAINAPYLETARYLASASLGAWSNIISIEDEGQREAERELLAANTTSMMVENAPGGTRAVQVTADVSQKGKDLAGILLRASKNRRTQSKP